MKFKFQKNSTVVTEEMAARRPSAKMAQLLEAERLDEPRTQKPRAAPAQLHADARKRLNKGDYKAALELFNEAARAAKKNAEHLLGAAGALPQLCSCILTMFET